MKGYKAFGKGLICRGKQYQENTVFEEDGEEICEPGMMHFCKEPLDVLCFYSLVNENGDIPEFAEVQALGKIKNHETKYATNKIKIGTRLSFANFINTAINAILKKTQSNNNKDLPDSGSNYVRIGSSDDCAQLGSRGKAVLIGSSGRRTQIGSSGPFVNIGSAGASTIIASSGYSTQIASSGNDTEIGATGFFTKIGSSGDGTHIVVSNDYAQVGSSGDYTFIKMTGYRSVAAAVGHDCVVSGKLGDWIVLAEWKTGTGKRILSCVKAGQIDGETLLEDVAYKLKNGEFVPAINERCEND